MFTSPGEHISKVHLHVEQFSQKTNYSWQRLLCKREFKERVKREGKKCD